MSYLISGGQNTTAINFAPPNIIEEVLQNVRTLLTTIKYSVPLYRALVIDATYLDKPAPDAMARLRVQIVEEIQCHEPRAIVKIIEFKPYEDEAHTGMFYPVLSIDVKEVRA